MIFFTHAWKILVCALFTEIMAFGCIVFYIEALIRENFLRKSRHNCSFAGAAQKQIICIRGLFSDFICFSFFYFTIRWRHWRGEANYRRSTAGRVPSARVVVLKLQANIMYRSTFGIEFGENRVNAFNFFRFWIFWKLALNCLTCKNFELSNSNFVRECTYTK